MPLFIFFHHFKTNSNTFIHTFITFAEAAPDFFIAFAQERDLHWGAGPGFEPGPAVQQADALLSELRRTLGQFRPVWIRIH